MPDTTATKLAARRILPTPRPRLAGHALELACGALFSAALAAGGTVLVTLALTAGVVGSPLVVLAAAAIALRRRAARATALAGLRLVPNG
jgi:hypothetical protein